FGCPRRRRLTRSTYRQDYADGLRASYHSATRSKTRCSVVIAARPTFRTDAFIDGTFRPALSGERFATEDPATGRLLAEVAAGEAADIDAAVRSARQAFDDGRWSRRSPAERKAVMLRLAELIEENAEELALLDSLEAGKPITDCREADLPESI